MILNTDREKYEPLNGGNFQDLSGTSDVSGNLESENESATGSDRVGGKQPERKLLIDSRVNIIDSELEKYFSDLSESDNLSYRLITVNGRNGIAILPNEGVIKTGKETVMNTQNLSNKIRIDQGIRKDEEDKMLDINAFTRNKESYEVKYKNKVRSILKNTKREIEEKWEGVSTKVAIANGDLGLLVWRTAG